MGRRGPQRVPAWALLVGFIALGCAPHRQFPDDCKRDGPLALVPVGQSETAVLAWSSRYARAYRLELPVLEPVELLPDAFDVGRNQYKADRLIEAIEAKHRAAHPKAVLIGLTDEDMYIESFDWNWAFARRVDRTAVVSTARMMPEPGDAGSLESRRTKMLTRQLGDLYCGFSRTGSPSSVMRRDVLSVEDLDEIDEANWKRR